MLQFFAVAVLAIANGVTAQVTEAPFVSFYALIRTCTLINAILQLMDSMEANPPVELRSQFPDRLWLFDHPDEPSQGDSWWALSNDKGNSPAYWVPIKPFDMGNTTTLDDAPEADSLDKRIPSYVQVYITANCKPTAGLFKKCKNPFGGTCCSLPPKGTFPGKSVYVPSFSEGDIIIPFRTRSCAGPAPAPMTYGFVGCYTGRGTVSSVKVQSCFGCRS